MVYIPNPRFDEEFPGDPACKEALMEGAGQVASAAEGLAEPALMPRSGDHFSATEWGDEIQAVNTDYAAHWREFGTAYTPVEAALRRGARAAGFRLEEGGPSD